MLSAKMPNTEVNQLKAALEDSKKELESLKRKLQEDSSNRMQGESLMEYIKRRIATLDPEQPGTGLPVLKKLCEEISTMVPKDLEEKMKYLRGNKWPSHTR